MDGNFLLDLLNVWLNLVLEFASLFAFVTLLDITTMFVNNVLSMLLCVLGLVAFCSVRKRLEKMRDMHISDPVPKELTLRPWLCCKDLVSIQHIVLLVVIPLKRMNLLLGLLIQAEIAKDMSTEDLFG